MNSFSSYQDPLKYSTFGKYNCDEMIKKEYTGEVKMLIDKLRDQFIEEYKQNKDDYLESDYERIVNSKNDWHCFRYLKHYRMNIETAFKGMKHTLRWRKETKIDEIDRSDLPKEMWLFGILFTCGSSKDGHPITYCLSNQYRPPKDERIRNLIKSYVCLLFESFDSSYPFDGQMDIVIDETGGSVHNVDLEILRWFVTIKDHWPSRVETLYVVGLPLLIQPVLRLILSWMPKEWQNLIKIGSVDQLLLGRVDKEELPWCYGGLKDATCRLAPTGTKWAREMEMFQDEKTMEHFRKVVWEHIPEKEREDLLELQSIYDKSLLN